MSARPVEVLLDKLQKVSGDGDHRWRARCPAHGGDNPTSLAIAETEAGAVLLYCHAHQCTYDEILGAVDLTRQTLSPKGERFDYQVREHGKFVTVKTVERRYKGNAKTFRQKGDSKRHLLYNLVAVEQAVKAGLEVWVVEGEKDAEALGLVGVTATTADGGAQSIGKADLEPLRKAERLVIVRDRDKPGKKWEQALLRNLAQQRPTPRHVTLARPPKGFHDAGDAVAANHTAADFRRREVAITFWDHQLVVTDPEDAPTSPWEPIDVCAILDGILDGTLEREAPELLSRGEDAGGLFYRGRVNGVHGESGSGKSWTALLAAAQELAKGERVVYVDYEDGPAGIVQRLVDLGTEPRALREHLSYINPDGPLDERAWAQVQDLVERQRPSLVVIDSTGEALAADGTAPNDDDEVARWFQRVPRRIAKLGPAVLVLDHSPKATDVSSKLFPIGSHRKRAAVDGAQYLQEAGQAFSREEAGWARLLCAKDRHGTYARAEHVASLHVTPHASGVHIEIAAPPKVTPVDKRADLMERISETLETMAVPLSARGIREHVKGNASEIAAATKELLARGFIDVRQVGQSFQHRHVKRFSQHGTTVTFPLGSEPVPGAVPLRAGTAEPVEDTGSGTGSEPVGTTTKKRSRKEKAS